MHYQWDFSVVFRDDGLFVRGMLETLRLTASSLLLAVPLARMAPVRLLSWAARAVIDFFRTSALFVLIVWFYFAFPVVFQISVSAFQAATLAIGLQASAYFAEIFRAGINAVGKGQWQAAQALGLRFPMTLRLIVLPQALQRILPVFCNLVIDTVKNTSFAAAIAYGELTYQGSRVASETYRPIETFTVIAVFYFVIIWSASRLVGLLERRMSVAGR
jgi:polar amino acid transport system permease protein